MTAHVTFNFAGTSVLVTGGTSGIGHATATLFRDAGADVTVTGTKSAAADYDTDLSGMTYRQLQITDAESVNALAAHFDRLDVLINNAGANFPGGLDESQPDGFDASVAVNLTAPYRLTVGLYKALKASTAAGGASVVNLASMSALRAVPLVPGYGAAKAGIIGASKALAIELAKRQITVNCVAPGLIETDLISAEILAHAMPMIPAQRAGKPEEVAALVAFLASDEAAFISGVCIEVDGARCV